jgi:hypothetical protein
VARNATRAAVARAALVMLSSEAAFAAGANEHTTFAALATFVNATGCIETAASWGAPRYHSAIARGSTIARGPAIARSSAIARDSAARTSATRRRARDRDSGFARGRDTAAGAIISRNRPFIVFGAAEREQQRRRRNQERILPITSLLLHEVS